MRLLPIGWLLVALATSILPVPAGASVVGSPPVLYRQYELRGSASVLGNTVMSYEHDPRINSLLLDPQWTRSELRNVPLDATVEGAYVFYSARMDWTVDATFRFGRPDGVERTLNADRCVSLLQFGETFYYCRRDVTAELREVTASRGHINGFYNAHGFDARPGRLGLLSNGCDSTDPNCQAAYGGWSLVVFWSSPSYPKTRNLNLYDGFLAMYEDHTSGISPPIQLSGFDVGDPAIGELAFFALEGDPHLGHPPLGPEWSDFMYFIAEDGRSAKLEDAVNPPNNLFNSTVPDSGAFFNGVDLDRFSIGDGGLGLLAPGQSTAWIRPGAGDGNPSYEGEFFILAWVMLAIDTVSPSFEEASSKLVDRTVAAAGDVLTYTITVENTGSQIATDVVVRDAPPAGTNYVPGSTSLDGAQVMDQGGQSALWQGLNIGTIDYRPGTTRRRTVTWKVRVSSAAADGANICNTATVDATEGALTSLSTSPCTLIEAPEIKDPPLLSVASLQGEPVQPGHRLRYRAAITNDGAQVARNMVYRQDLPPYVRDLQVVARPAGSIDSSTSFGGASGTGVVEITNVRVPGDFTVEILFEVTVLDFEGLVAAGVPPSSIHGLMLSTQGEVSAPWLSLAMLTDDPRTATWPDPTNVVLSWHTDLSTSTKSGRDLDGGLLEPGDLVQYDIAIRNRGTVPASAHLHDDLPIGVSECRLLEAPSGVSCADTGGTNGTGTLVASGLLVGSGETVWIRYTVRVKDDADDGTVLRNRAVLSSDESQQVFVLETAPLEVYARPHLEMSTKAVSGHQNRFVEPGNELTYEITVKNTGNRVATNVRVEDELPAELTATFIGDGGSAVNGKLVWQFPSTQSLLGIQPGDSVSLSYSARVALPLDDGTVISNQASIFASELAHGAVTGDADTPDPNDPTRVIVRSSPALHATKAVENLSGSLAEVRPGHRLRYVIRVGNTGNAVARSVVVDDPLPSGLVDVQPLDGGTLAGHTVRWDLGDVGPSPDGDVLVRFEATVLSPLANGTVIPNQALVLSDGMEEPVLTGDPRTSATDDPTTVLVTSEATLVAEKSVTDLSGGATLPGDRLEYRVLLSAAGDSPTREISVTDPIDHCLVDVEPLDGGVYDGTAIRWTGSGNASLSSLNPGSTVELRFRATVRPGTPDGTACANQAFVESSDLSRIVPSGDPRTNVPEDPTIVIVESRPVLDESTKAVELLEDRGANGLFSPGDRIRYTLVVANTGTETASSLAVTDELPAQLTNVLLSNSGQIVGNEARWSLGSLPSGASATLTIEADIVAPLDDGTVVENQASISWSGMDAPALTSDPATPERGDPTRVVLSSIPVFEQTTKSVSFLEGEPARPGHELAYEIVVRNTGTSLARQVEVKDTLDENLELISIGEGGVYDAATRTVTWVLGTVELSPQGDKALPLRVRIVSPLDNGTIIDNQALVSAVELDDPVPSGDPRTSTLGDPTRVVVVAGSSLASSTKAVDAASGIATPGQELTWTISIRNDGDAVARNVVVTDRLDARLVEVEPGQGGVLLNGEILWTSSSTPSLAAVWPGEAVDLTFTSVVARPLDDGTVIENQAFSRADDLAEPVGTSDPSTEAFQDPTRVTIVSTPDLLGSTKSPSVDSARPGETITWTIKLSNSGDMVARDLLVIDELDANLEFVSASAGGLFDPATHRVTWTRESLELSPDGDDELLLHTRVVSPLDDGVVVLNQAFMSWAGFDVRVPTSDPRTPATGDASEVLIEAEPVLVFSKLAENLDGSQSDIVSAEPGDRIRYTLRLENEGDMVARQVLVHDVIDATLVDVLVEAGTWNESTRTASWPALDIAPGGPVDMIVEGTVAPLSAGGTVIENQARAAYSGEVVLSSDVSAPGSGEPTKVLVVASPVLSASTKAVLDEDGGLVRPGDSLLWTIRVINTGNTYATSVVVEDLIDPWLTDIQVGQGGVLQGSTVRWDSTATPALASVSPEHGGEVVLTFTSRIRDDAPDGTVISNQARLLCAELDSPALTGNADTPAAGDPTEIAVSIPVIVAKKTVVNESGGDVSPGDQLRWTIEIRNEGSHSASNIEVRDPLDTANLVDVVAEDGGLFDGSSIVWTVSSIDPGGVERVSFTSRVRPLLANGTVISNQAFVLVSELGVEVATFDPATAAMDDPTTVTVVASPDFTGATSSVENLTGQDDMVRPGDRLRFTLTFENAGDTLATDVVVSSVVDHNLLNVTFDPPGRLEGELMRWTAAELPPLAALAPEDGVVLHIEGDVRSPLAHGTLIRSQGRLVAAENDVGWLTGDPRTPALSDPTIVSVWSAPRFSRSEKSVTNLVGSVEDVSPGDVLEYTLLVVNDGTEDATGVRLVDPVPTWTSYERGSTTVNGQPVPDAPGGTSPLAAGILVSSSRPGTPPGTVLAESGGSVSDETAVVVFRARVLEDTPGGTVISNQGFVSCDRTQRVGTSDPRTPELGDPTLVFVGQVLHLSGTTKTWRLVEDHNTPGVVEVGDTVAYEIILINRGNAPAKDVRFRDSLARGASYVSGSLTLDGQPLTDAPGSDAGSVTGDLVTVALSVLRAGERAVVGFQVEVNEDAPPTLVNQGEVEALAPWGERVRVLTDADPSTPFAQPTVIPIGTLPVWDLSTSGKSVADLDGGRVEPGDMLLYTIHVRNSGNALLEDVVLVDDIPAHTTFVSVSGPPTVETSFEPPPAGDHGRGRLVVALRDALGTGDAVSVSLTVRVEGRAALGTVIENFALLEATHVEPFETNTVRLIVGGAPGTGGFSGRVYRDLGGTGRYDPGDPVFPAFEVVVEPMRAEKKQGKFEVMRTTAGQDGRYLVLGVPPGDYRLVFKSREGTRFFSAQAETLREDAIVEHDGLIDPSGIVYRAGSTDGIPGARLWLLYDDESVGAAPLPCDEDQSPVGLVADLAIGASDDRPLPRAVGAACLPEGQQGQPSSSAEALGYYRFDIPASDPPRPYRLSVVSPAPRLAFPSRTVPPQTGYAPPGPAVSLPSPDPNGSTDYWLRFLLGDVDDEVTNNHIPLDGLESLVAVRKHTGRSTATIGELVPYTVTVTNQSGSDIRGIGGVAGGLAIRDLVPDGMRYVRGTSRATRMAYGPDGEVLRLCPRVGEDMVGCPSQRLEPALRGLDSTRPTIGEVLDYGPFDLPAGQTLELRYTLVVAADASPGERVNRASALLDNVMLGEARAAVRIVPDPLFEMATLFGKVYCDDDDDGNQDPGDLGLPGVRIFADVGHYAITDGSGKWHLQRLPVGMRLFKLDERTLPPGVRLLDPPSRPVFLTPGLDTTLSWRAECALERVPPDFVDVLVVRELPPVELAADPNGLWLELGGERLPTLTADARVWSDADRNVVGEPDWPPVMIGLPEDLHFHLSFDLEVESWRLVMAEVPIDDPSAEPRTWNEVFALTGDGQPPPRIHVPEGASELEPEALYAYWLLVTGSDGSAARSPVRVMAVVAESDDVEPTTTVVDEREGDLFGSDGVTPSPRLAGELGTAAEALQTNPGWRVRLTVHVDASFGDRADETALERARSVRQWLLEQGLEADRVDAGGAGSSEPVVPNIGPRNRAMNRRVEIVLTPGPAERPDLPSLRFESRVLVGGVGLLEPDGDSAHRLMLPPLEDRTLVVGLQRGDGATLGLAKLLDREGRAKTVDDDVRSLLGSLAKAAAVGVVPDDGESPGRPSDAPDERAPGDESDSKPTTAGPRRFAIRLFVPPEPAPGHLEVNGRRFALPLLDLHVRANSEAIFLEADGDIADSLTFALSAPPECSKWWLELGREGERARVAGGDGVPPRDIALDAGDLRVPGGEHLAYRLCVEDSKANEACSAIGRVAIAPPPHEEIHRNLVDDGAVTAEGMDVLRALVERALGHGLGAKVHLEAHTDTAGGALEAIARTESIAGALKRAISNLGLPEVDVIAEGRGAEEPIVPNLNPRNRATNNRVVIRLLSPGTVPPPLEAVARFVVAKVEASREDENAWVAYLEDIPPKLDVQVVTDDGRVARYTFEISEEVLNGLRPIETNEDRSRAATSTVAMVQAEYGGEHNDSSTGMPPPEPGAAGGILGSWVDRLRNVATRREGSGIRTPRSEVAARANAGEGSQGDSASSGAKDTIDMSAGAGPLPSSLSDQHSDVVVQRVHVRDVDLSAVPAARTLVHLPAAGAVVQSKTLGVMGQTVPENTVTINGLEAHVDADGRFARVVELPRGASVVTIEVTDPGGNVGTISRELVSEPDGLFVLAMAESQLGPRGAKLAGVTDRTSIDLGPMYLHARGAAYVKGSWRVEDLPFEELELTVHLDTSKEREASYFADLQATERQYPVWGDAGQEVQDVSGTGPLYVSARADDNELRLGTFHTDPGVGGLFRYRRSFHGARLRLDQPALDGTLHSRGEIFAARDPAGIRPGHVVMQGTGGSLYFLRHRDLVEGSERVRVVVRDRETGVELTSRYLTRNGDYVVRHREGHVMLMSPLPSVAEAGWMTGMSYSGALNGHPVFLVVDYEYVAGPVDGGLAAGGYVTETISDWVTVGAGVLGQDDGTDSAAYRLWGLFGEVRPMPKTFLRAELARSRGADVGGFYSMDGGLSYASLLPECLGAAMSSELCRNAGGAYKIELGTTLGELLQQPDDVVRFGAHLHYQDRGFYGSQLLLDHGQRRLGTSASWDITEKDLLSARVDRVASDIPLAMLVDGTEPTREVVRTFSGLRYQRTEERFRAAGEWSYARIRDPAVLDDPNAWDRQSLTLSTHRLGAGGEYDATERLTFVLEQDLTLGGDPRMFERANDRFSTTFGARWLLTESLRLSALGQVRWNGETSALVGTQAKTGERGNVYASQRLTRLTSGAGWRADSIVGADQEILPGVRSYGEYQLAGGVSGQHGRAVVGTSTRWELYEGVTAGLSYERVQVLGDYGLGPVVPGATYDPESQRVSTTGRVDGTAPFAAAGTNPSGSFYPGAIARDAASASVEVHIDPVKASGRLELRYDNADDALVETLPGVADRFQTVALFNAVWSWTRDLAGIGRLNYAGTTNMTRRDRGLEAREALWFELTGGVAFRPESYDWVNVLAKYTRLVDQRPLDLTLGIGDRHSSHVVSLAPVVRTPWKATLSEKVAYKNTTMLVGLGEPSELRPPEARAHTLLWVNRLDLHVLQSFDLTGEYRVLWVGAEDARAREGGAVVLSSTVRSGFVLEVAWRAAEHLRLGVGYSFASFSDDELSRFDRDERGPFIRVTGFY